MSPDSTYSHPTLQPKKRSPWLVVGIVLGTSLFGFVFLAWCYFVYYRSGKELPVNDLDKVVVVTAKDLQTYVPELVVRGDAEVFRKHRFVDGQVELQYKYEHPDPDLSLYIVCTIQAHTSVLEARQTYLLQDAASKTAFKWLYDAAEFELRDELFEWGDELTFGVITDGGTTVGNYFACRQGRLTFTLQMYGESADQTLVYSEIVMPALQQLDRFEQSLFGDED